jgi:hypothetical protein
MEIRPADMEEHQEQYDIGEIRCGRINLETSYQTYLESRTIKLDSADAFVTLDHRFDAPVPVVWDWFVDPVKHTRWAPGSDWSMRTRPAGRTGRTATNHCAASNFIEQVLDWRPFEYYTVCIQRGKIEMLITCQFDSAGTGTRLTWTGRLEGSMPAWIRRQLARLLLYRFMRIEEGLNRLEALLALETERNTDDGSINQRAVSAVP